MSRTRYKIFENQTPYFLTCTVVNWIPVFSIPETGKIIFDSLNFLRSEERLILWAYVLMENHMHLIASASNLSKEMASFKSYTARIIIDYLIIKNFRGYLKQLVFSKLAHKTDRKYQFWQEGNHAQQIQSLEMMEQKVNYIHQNPVRRGYVDDPVHWRYSSARNYAGMHGMIEVATNWW